MNMLPPAKVMPYTGRFADRPHFEEKTAPACGKAAGGRVARVLQPHFMPGKIAARILLESDLRRKSKDGDIFGNLVQNFFDGSLGAVTAGRLHREPPGGIAARGFSVDVNSVQFRTFWEFRKKARGSF